VAAIPFAASAAASPTSQESCTSAGPTSTCQSPGNVQINDAPPATDFYPYGGDAFLLGGGGGFGGGGFGGGGFHGGGGHGGGGHR
jgi:hypothetical protein